MKKLITFIIAIIATVSVKAQNGGIEGRITDNNDLPIPGVNITLKGTSIGTITNANGYFILNGIAQGKQTFLFSTIWKFFDFLNTKTVRMGSCDHFAVPGYSNSFPQP